MSRFFFWLLIIVLISLQVNWLNRGKDTKNIQYNIRIEQKSADFIQYDEQNE